MVWEPGLLWLWSSWLCPVCAPLVGVGYLQLLHQKTGLGFFHVETCICFHSSSVFPESGSDTEAYEAPGLGQVFPRQRPC